ncbi:MAG: hypothetical protein IJB34_04385 [Clostridia bacterium]|nr:hypothetical protein [Clostridia bacterium]
MQQNIRITKEQIETLRPFIPKIDEYLKSMDIDAFLREIDDAEIGELDDNYNETPTSRTIRKLYIEISEQN